MFLVVGTWVLAWATSSVTSQVVELVQTKKCANIDEQLETCIAYGYKEKWIKCASKLFAIEHLGYDDINNGITSQNAHQARPGQEQNEKEMVNKGMPVNAQIKRGKGRNYAQNILNDANKVIRTKRDSKLISPTMDFESKYTEIKDKLSEKEKRGCRGVERKIKKNCASETKYSCVRLANALGERRRKMAEISGVLPGGSKYAEFNDPLISEAIKRVLMEFKRRAYTSGNMKPEETIIMGEVVEVTTAVVAGSLYKMTINLGITSDPVCKQNTYNGIVPYKKCDDDDSMGKAELSVCYQVWSDIQWKWFEYKDLEGTPLKEKYWDN